MKELQTLFILRSFKNLFKNYENQIFILILYNLTNLINFLFQLIASKKLLAEEFSLYFSSVSLVAIIVGPFVALQLLFQKQFIDYGKKNSIKDQNNLLDFSVKFFFLLQLFFLIFFIFFLDDLQSKYKYNNDYFFYLLFLFNLSNFFLIIPISVLYSQKKYKLVNLVLLILDVFRFLSLFLFVEYLSNKINFMIIINILSSLLSTLILFFYVNFSLRSLLFLNIKKFYISLKKYIKKISIFVLYSSFWPLIYQLDIVFTRIFFSSDISSSYVVISSLSKIIMIIPHALQAYIFNQINLNKKLFSRELTLNYIFYLLISITTIIIIFLFLESFINFIYGTYFSQTIQSLPYIVFSFFFISMSSLLSHLLLISGKYIFIFFIYMTIILYVFLTYFFHATFIQISTNLLICSFILFVLILSFVINLSKKK
jgi:O-antigen/teichoic acid export membrane protein